MANKTTKLAVIISHPIQYWVPVYRHLSLIEGLALKVFYVAENGAHDYFDEQFNKTIRWDVPLTDGYEYQFLTPGRVVDNYRFLTIDDVSVTKKLKEFSPDFIWVNGYAHAIIWRALFALRDSAKFIVNSDSNIDDPRSRWKGFIKNTVVRYFYSQMHASISCSPRNREYLMHYGVTESQIVDSVMPVDIERLTHQFNTIKDTEIEALRVQLGFTNSTKVILFVGKLIEHKRPKDVIEVLKRVIDLGHSDSVAIIVGSGELEHEMKEMVQRYSLESQVRFVGFINQSRLAPFYMASNVLLFPSAKEPYGVIANEVLPFGLPIVAADNIGSVGASIIEGKNALLYKNGDLDQCSKQIVTLFNDGALNERLSLGALALAPSLDARVLANDIGEICLQPEE
ncbi:MAG: glycosyltransferase family 4 protein [Acidiferrobacterales bacterium]|nr:glycosyltransferase family 4 protein [Acidiferrobacterales bacterium]